MADTEYTTFMSCIYYDGDSAFHWAIIMWFAFTGNLIDKYWISANSTVRFDLFILDDLPRKQKIKKIAGHSLDVIKCNPNYRYKLYILNAPKKMVQKWQLNILL